MIPLWVIIGLFVLAGAIWLWLHNDKLQEEKKTNPHATIRDVVGNPDHPQLKKDVDTIYRISTEKLAIIKSKMNDYTDFEKFFSAAYTDIEIFMEKMRDFTYIEMAIDRKEQYKGYYLNNIDISYYNKYSKRMNEMKEELQEYSVRNYGVNI